MERLEASIVSTLFRNHENGYSVVSTIVEGDEVTVVGAMPELSRGEQVVLTGEWVNHPTYGKQLKVASCEIQAPTTLKGIERYLGSGLIRGVGAKTAKEIVKHFGLDTLEVLTNHPERLREVPGMGKKRWQMVTESFLEQQRSREAMMLLQGYGISPALATRIILLYGENTADIIRNNPYRLCQDLDGVGFRTADRIAAAAGIASDSEFRIQSAIIYVLKEQAASMGHVYLPKEELMWRTAELLNLPS